MYKTILVPLDGSAFGEQALPLALSLARSSNAAVAIVNVHVPLSAIYTESIPNVEIAYEPQLKREAQAYLDKTVKRLSAGSGVGVSAELLEGPVVDAIHEHVLGRKADLVVMTTHGRGPLSRWWLGSVADELARRLPVPLLVVRPKDPTSEPELELNLRRVLIPLDGSPMAEQILPIATGLGSLMKAEYTLLRVVRPFAVNGFDPGGIAIGGVMPVSMDHLCKDAAEYLDRVARRLREQGHRVETLVAVNDQPAVSILDVVQEHKCHLVALETHARRGFVRLMLGSVADKIMRGSPVPVLLHRPMVK